MIDKNIAHYLSFFYFEIVRIHLNGPAIQDAFFNIFLILSQLSIALAAKDRLFIFWKYEITIKKQTCSFPLFPRMILIIYIQSF